MCSYMRWQTSWPSEPLDAAAAVAQEPETATEIQFVGAGAE